MALDSSPGFAPLFRDEAVREKTARLGGELILPNAALLSVGAGVSLLALAGLALLLAFGEYAPRQVVSGYLAPESGLVRVMPARPGIVVEVHVHEGDSVSVGQTLAVVSVDSATTTGDGAQALVLGSLADEERQLAETSRRETELAQLQKKRLEEKLDSAHDQLGESRREQGALARKIASARTGLQRWQQLHDRGYVTAHELAGKHEQILDLEREWHALEKSATGIEAAIVETELLLRQQPVELRQKLAQIDSRLAEIARQRALSQREQSYAIVAPIAGRATALQTEKGKPADPGQPLLAILSDDARLEAHLLVPSRAVGLVEAGQEVALRYAAYPYQRYGVHHARVTSLSRTTLAPAELSTPIRVEEPMYRVSAQLERQTVIVAGRELPLQAGALLQADIVQEPRSLWAWLLEPLLSYRGTT